MTRRVRVGVMTVRSASHPRGPSLVVGVSSVHEVSRVVAASTSGAVSLPSPTQRHERLVARGAQAPARSAIAPAGDGFVGEFARPIGEVEYERGWVAKVGQVDRGLYGLSKDGHRLPGEGCVDAALQGDDILAGGGGGDGSEVVLALLGGAGAERVPAQGGGADAAEVGVALVPERSLTRGAPGDQQ